MERMVRSLVRWTLPALLLSCAPAATEDWRVTTSTAPAESVSVGGWWHCAPPRVMASGRCALPDEVDRHRRRVEISPVPGMVEARRGPVGASSAGIAAGGRPLSRGESAVAAPAAAKTTLPSGATTAVTPSQGCCDFHGGPTISCASQRVVCADGALSPICGC
jgi:hypothetical protein